ncbi:ATP-dependent endonuclease [Elizabethkingia anophelis]|nr:ATP-dependent endonuclease [Elizabethkingia anophelis]
MHIKTIRVQNFRRLKNALIDLEQETSIFVGSNNSGKTSATYILQKFLDPNSKPFSIHDFSSDCWKQINNQALTENETSLNFPSISLDIWFDVTSSDLHRIIDLLPNLDWKEVPVGVRIEYAPKNPKLLIANYKELNSKAVEKAKANYLPWPKTLTDYLSKNLKNEYETKYYVLDWDQFDDTMNAIEGYIPLQLGNEKDRPGSKILKSLIKIDMLNAQRFLDDQGSGGRAEDLSKRMNRFYDRNLEKKEDDFDAMQALATSESELTKHLKTVFNPTLQSLNKLGYPGFSNPKLEVKATLNHESIIGQTRLHYSLGSGDEFLSLPDRYNGLGFKNLIYMVIEILDFHTRWLEEEENRAPLHLIIIEEPEAHLHAQLQQVFIKKIWDIINPSDAVENSFNSQMIVTTHSPHIIYESGFQPIRYFQRHITDSGIQTTNVLNLTTFYNKSHEYSRDFLQRYMKLTHCDLFFADGAILVEGNVERLLLPLMINKSAKQLNSTYLSIIEVGGAYGYIFKQLIDFIGLTTLIITDLDSVKSTPVPMTEGISNEEIPNNEKTNSGTELTTSDVTKTVVEEILDENGEDLLSKPRSSCISDFEGAVTSNQTLIKWLPKLNNIKDLLDAPIEKKIQDKTSESNAYVHITYQTRTEVSWNGEKGMYAGRTLEESFALENLEWTQNIAQKHLGLRVITNENKRTLEDVRIRLYKRVNEGSFNKTNFALGLMLKDPKQWNVPIYITSGLEWLKEKIAFFEDEPDLVEELVNAETEVVIETKSKKTDEQKTK